MISSAVASGFSKLTGGGTVSAIRFSSAISVSAFSAEIVTDAGLSRLRLADLSRLLLLSDAGSEFRSVRAYDLATGQMHFLDPGEARASWLTVEARPL